MQIFSGPHRDLAEVLHRDRHHRLSHPHLEDVAPRRRGGGSAAATRLFRRREG